MKSSVWMLGVAGAVLLAVLGTLTLVFWYVDPNAAVFRDVVWCVSMSWAVSIALMGNVADAAVAAVHAEYAREADDLMEKVDAALAAINEMEKEIK